MKGLTLEEIFQWKRGDIEEYTKLIKRRRYYENKLRRLNSDLDDLADALQILNEPIINGEVVTIEYLDRIHKREVEYNEIKIEIGKYLKKLNNVKNEIKQYC